MKLYVTNTEAKAEKVQDIIHELMIKFHQGYKADRWAFPLKHKTLARWGVILPDVSHLRWRNVKNHLPAAFDKSKVISVEKTDANWFNQDTGL